jgi:hypothetical protein
MTENVEIFVGNVGFQQNSSPYLIDVARSVWCAILGMEDIPIEADNLINGLSF